MLNLNRYERKQKHKATLKRQATPYRYHSYNDFLAHIDQDDQYWKGIGDRWWNESDGANSLKVFWKKHNHGIERAFWNRVLNSVDLMDFDDDKIPVFSRGFQFGDVWDLW